jgi:hypothetical protein
MQADDPLSSTITWWSAPKRRPPARMPMRCTPCSARITNSPALPWRIRPAPCDSPSSSGNSAHSVRPDWQPPPMLPLRTWRDVPTTSPVHQQGDQRKVPVHPKPQTASRGPTMASNADSVSPADRRAVRRIRFLHPKRNPRLVRVVGAHLHLHHVARGDLDVVLPQLTRDVSKDDMAVGQLHSEHCPRQNGDDPALQFNCVAFRGRGGGSLGCFGFGRLECSQNLQ